MSAIRILTGMYTSNNYSSKSNADIFANSDLIGGIKVHILIDTTFVTYPNILDVSVIYIYQMGSFGNFA